MICKYLTAISKTRPERWAYGFYIPIKSCQMSMWLLYTRQELTGEHMDPMYKTKAGRWASGSYIQDMSWQASMWLLYTEQELTIEHLAFIHKTRAGRWACGPYIQDISWHVSMRLLPYIQDMRWQMSMWLLYTRHELTGGHGASVYKTYDGAWTFDFFALGMRRHASLWFPHSSYQN